MRSASVHYRDMILFRNSYFFTTSGLDHFIVTHDVKALIAEGNVDQGVVHIIVPKAGASVMLAEDIPEIKEAVKKMFSVFESLSDEKAKNKRKEELELFPRLQSTMLGRQLCIPIQNGKLVLSPFEDIILLDFEALAGRRECVIQVMSESAPAEAPQQQRM